MESHGVNTVCQFGSSWMQSIQILILIWSFQKVMQIKNKLLMAFRVTQNVDLTTVLAVLTAY
jgi:hypothetical protein